MGSGFDLMQFLGLVALVFVPMIFSLCFHEYAHGIVAKWRGDNTAQMMGRLTMNPLAHADPLGTFFLPLISLATGIRLLFGWAKPVPVNTRNLKNPVVDMFWIALAGPASNVLLALLGTLAWRFIEGSMGTAEHGYYNAATSFVVAFIQINLNLALFNLIPVHPLDGGKILARFLPAKLNDWLESNEMLMSALLMLIVFGGFVGWMWKPGMPLHFVAGLLQSFAMGGR